MPNTIKTFVKIPYIFICLYLVFGSCQDKLKESNTQNSKQNEAKEFLIEKQTPELSIEQKLKNILSINYDKESQNYISDTTTYKQFQYILLGKLNSVDLNKHYFFLPIDSIIILKPIKAIIKGVGIGGYLLKKNRFVFKDIIKFNDINNDEKIDILVFNEMSSGVSGPSTFNIYLNKTNKFEFFKETNNKALFVDY